VAANRRLSLFLDVRNHAVSSHACGGLLPLDSLHSQLTACVGGREEGRVGELLGLVAEADE
jgi:hypothetical protein